MDLLKCLDEIELLKFTEGSLTEKALENWREHLAGCPHCRARLAGLCDAQTLNPEEAAAEPVTAKKSVRRYLAKKMPRRVFSLGVRSPWFWVSLGAWVLSFIFPKHFLQFLFLAVLTGGKWIIDERRPQNHLTFIRTTGSNDPLSDQGAKTDSARPALKFWGQP